MKKSAAVYMIFISFIIGAIISALAVYFFVHINEIEKIEQNNKATIDSLNKKIEDLKKLNQRLEMVRLEKQKKFQNLIQDIKTKDYSELTKNILLSKDISKDSDFNKLLLDPGMLQPHVKEIPEDDSDIKALKKELDMKTKEILESAGFILREKVNKLNLRIMEKNKVLSDTNQKLDKTNLELDKSNQELDKSNTQLSNLNTELEKKNRELEQSLDSIKRFKNKLESQNQVLNKSLEEIQNYKKKLETHKKQIVALKKVETELNKAKADLETKLEDGRLKVNFKGDILFESGSHTLKIEGKELINSVLPILKNSLSENNIFIAGHTDNQKIRESSKKKYESNWDLSTYRAIEVVKFLINKGIRPSHVTAAGFGEFRPISDNKTDLGRQKNRRVELFLIPKIIKRDNERQ